MKKAVLLSIVAVGITACSGDTPFTALDHQAALKTAENQEGGETALLEYEIRTLAIRYTESHGPLIDSNRVRFREYEDGFTWSRIDDQLPAVTSGTTLDGTSIHYASTNRRGGWSANPQASYLPQAENRTSDIDREALKRAILALPWVQGTSASSVKRQDRPLRPPAPAIRWRSPVMPAVSDAGERLAALRAKSVQETRVAESMIRFRIGDTPTGNFVDAVFDEAIGEVVGQITYRDGVKRSTLTRQYDEFGDGQRLTGEVFEWLGDDGETKQRIERTFYYTM